MSVERVLRQGADVAAVLRRNGHSDAASYLETQLGELNDPARRSAAAREIQVLCHVRAYGDLYIRDLDLDEWWSKLAGLGKSCTRLIGK